MQNNKHPNSFNALQVLNNANHHYYYYSLTAAQQSGLPNLERMPYALKILLENLLRHEDGTTVTVEDIHTLVQFPQSHVFNHEIAFRPARILMQDFTGVPAIADLAAMRETVQGLGSFSQIVNPLTPVDLVIDHSVQVNVYGSAAASTTNTAIEYKNNHERYNFLRWGQQAFKNFRVVPPGTGICHQVNLEYLAQVVWKSEKNGQEVLYPDTLVGTDSHTTMINGLGVLGWGVGGIEAEAAMLGQPISMLIPEVIGMRLIHRLPEGVTATDLVLHITQQLRKFGVVGKFVEFFGPGLAELPLPDRATIANMAPEYGATCGIFPIDKHTLAYLKLTGRSAITLQLVEAYAKIQGFWYDENSIEANYTHVIELNLVDIKPCIAGPKRPQDQVALSQVREAFASIMSSTLYQSTNITDSSTNILGQALPLNHGDIVIAAITSCTNTSNPSVLMAAGLVAKKACTLGLQTKPWVKVSFAPGSQVATDYLTKAGLMQYLEQLGFFLVGYGCTTCIGNSGPLAPAIEQAIVQRQLAVCSILSGNRNFEGRIHPLIKANWLASPPLVVAYALVGTINSDITQEPLGYDAKGQGIFLKDIWSSNAEIAEACRALDETMFLQRYNNVFTGDAEWQNLSSSEDEIYTWDPRSTYVRKPPFFETFTREKPVLHPITHARILALLGDSITTDHISPAGNIKANSPAGDYLKAHQVAITDFNSYGSRRGNHEVMIRGTFANIRLRNEMVPNLEGGFTRFIPTQETMTLYDAAMRYQQENQPLVIIAGCEYGTGSSRDWAAKGTVLLGVKAVIAESFERIHRSNLIGMGVLPLEFRDKMTRHTLKLTGDELITIKGIETSLAPHCILQCQIIYSDGHTVSCPLTCRIDTQTELDYFYHGGIMPFVIRQLMQTHDV